MASARSSWVGVYDINNCTAIAENSSTPADESLGDQDKQKDVVQQADLWMTSANDFLLSGVIKLRTCTSNLADASSRSLFELLSFDRQPHACMTVDDVIKTSRHVEGRVLHLRAVRGKAAQQLLNLTMVYKQHTSPVRAQVQELSENFTQKITSCVLDFSGSRKKFADAIRLVSLREMLEHMCIAPEEQAMHEWLRGFGCGVTTTHLSLGWTSSRACIEEGIEMVAFDSSQAGSSQAAKLSNLYRRQLYRRCALASSAVEAEVGDETLGATRYGRALLGYFNSLLTGLERYNPSSAAPSLEAFFSSTASECHLGVDLESPEAWMQIQSKDECMQTRECKVRILLRGSPVGTCRIRNGETAKRAAARFISKHSVDTSFQAPLRLFLKKTMRDTESSCQELVAELEDLHREYCSA